MDAGHIYESHKPVCKDSAWVTLSSPTTMLMSWGWVVLSILCKEEKTLLGLEKSLKLVA